MTDPCDTRDYWKAKEESLRLMEEILRLNDSLREKDKVIAEYKEELSQQVNVAETLREELMEKTRTIEFYTQQLDRVEKKGKLLFEQKLQKELAKRGYSGQQRVPITSTFLKLYEQTEQGLLTKTKMAKMLGVSRTTLYRMIDDYKDSFTATDIPDMKNLVEQAGKEVLKQQQEEQEQLQHETLSLIEEVNKEETTSDTNTEETTLIDEVNKAEEIDN